MIEEFRDDTLSTLTSNELDFLYFAELHLDEMDSWTLEEAARQSLTSGSVIERACKKLGLSGFSELKYRIRSSRRGKGTIAQNLAVEYPAHRAADAINRETEAAVPHLSAKEVGRATSLIGAAERLVIFARGLSEFPAQYLSEYLYRLGRTNRCYTDPPFVYRDASTFGPKDCLVIFSCGGRTIPVVKAATIARRKEVPLVAICGNRESPLAELATSLLYAPADTFVMDQIDLRSRLTQFLAADLVVDALQRQRRQDTQS